MSNIKILFESEKLYLSPWGSQIFFFFCQDFKQTPQVIKFWLNL